MTDRVWNPHRPEMPVDADGNWLSYPNYEQSDWYAVEQPFYAVMEVDGMRTGRSSKLVVLKDMAGKTYPMFVADLVKGIMEQSLEIANGYLRAHWTGSKRGANYGVKPVRIK